ncbi:MAG: T9SS type B sorting domain-containing protein [Bacteroidota bacterium]
MKKLFFCFIFLFFIFKGYSQTYTWNAYPAGGSAYTNGNMSVAVTSSGAYFQSGTPKYVAAGNNADHPSNGNFYCTSEGLLLAVDWPNISQSVTITITFATPVCGPVTFSLFDINADFYDDGTTKFTYYTDKVDISATDGASAAIPTGSVAVAGCSNLYSTTGAARTITADYNNCACGSNDVTITSSTLVKTIVIKYYSGPATYGPTPTYPSWQYLVLSNIIAIAPPTPAIAGPDQTVCGTTATLAGNTAVSGAGTWTLVSGSGSITTPSSSTSSVTGLGAGANVFQWTISNACGTSSSQVTITSNPAMTTPIAGPDQSLCSTSATLAGNTPTVGTGLWTLVSGSGTITSSSLPNSGVTNLGTGANVFQWTISNPPCTPLSSQVTITGVVSPTVSNAGTDETVCSTSATLTGNTPTAGTGLWTVISGTGTITTPSSATSGITGLGAGATVFEWTISNTCGTSSSQVTITANPATTIPVAGANQNVCSTIATLAGNTPTVGTGLWTLVSGSGAITSPSFPNSGVTGLGTGPTVFQWTISNAPCAPLSSQVTITGVVSPTIANVGADQIVCSTSATLAGNIATTGTGLWTLVSGTGTISTPSSPNSTVTGLGAGATVFQWTISNSPCLSSSDQVTITNTGGGLTVTISAQTNVSCYGGNNGSLIASATGGAGSLTYLWAPGGGAAPTANNLLAGTYTISVTDGSGCVGIETAAITQPDSIVAIVSTTPSSCGSTNGSATVVATGGTGSLTYLWNNGGATTATINNIGAGSYIVTITDSLACIKTGIGTIATTGGPTANAGVNSTISSGSSTQLTASGGISYFWTPPTGLDCDTCRTPSASPVGTTTYCVMVSDNGGCTDTACITITVIDTVPIVLCGTVYVPDAFTPANNDLVNDVFKPVTTCVHDYRFLIFNRWGEKLFETSNPGEGWNGYYKGVLSKQDVYVYKLFFMDPKNEFHQEIGKFLLLR